MKQKLVLVAGLCATLFSCQNNSYKIDGTFPSEAGLDGKYAFLQVVDEDHPRGGVKLDSAKVENGQFHFEGELNDSIQEVVVVSGSYGTPLLLEAGTITVDMKDPAAKGTPLNDALFAMSTEYADLVKDAKAKIEDLRKKASSLGDKATQEEREAIQTDYQAIIKSFHDTLRVSSLKVFKEHPNDFVGVTALNKLLKTNPSDEELAEWKSLAGEKVLKHHLVKKDFDYLDAKKATAVGQKYRDFEGLNDNSDPVKLSDYVGHGKYVLLDFWASWCGPCRGELPNLKALRKQYTEDQLTIVGVAVMDKMENHLKAVEDEKVTWPQIVSEEEATQLYAIRGIPQIMLIAPDGTIVARDLRGAKIGEKLAEVIK